MEINYYKLSVQNAVVQDLKKTRNKIKKAQKAIDKIGAKPVNKTQAKEKEPEIHEKSYKLVKLDKAALSAYFEGDMNEYVDLQQADDGWAVTIDDNIVGYLPASAASYMVEHEDEMSSEPEIDKEGKVLLTFIY